MSGTVNDTSRGELNVMAAVGPIGLKPTKKFKSASLPIVAL